MKVHYCSAWNQWWWNGCRTTLGWMTRCLRLRKLLWKQAFLHLLVTWTVLAKLSVPRWLRLRVPSHSRCRSNSKEPRRSRPSGRCRRAYSWLRVEALSSNRSKISMLLKEENLSTVFSPVSLRFSLMKATRSAANRTSRKGTMHLDACSLTEQHGRSAK